MYEHESVVNPDPHEVNADPKQCYHPAILLLPHSFYNLWYFSCDVRVTNPLKNYNVNIAGEDFPRGTDFCHHWLIDGFADPIL